MKPTMKKKQKKTQSSKKEEGLDIISKRVIVRPPSLGNQVRIAKISRFDTIPKTLNWSASATVLNGWSFKLSNIPDYTEFVDAYDYYRITRIDVIFYPQNITGPPSGTSISGGPPIVWITPDWSDINASSLSKVAQHEMVMIKPAYQQWEFSFVPRTSVEIYSTALATGGYMVGPPKGWYHTESSNIEFYGLKTALSQTASGAVVAGAMYFRYHLDLMVGR